MEALRRRSSDASDLTKLGAGFGVDRPHTLRQQLIHCRHAGSCDSVSIATRSSLQVALSALQPCIMQHVYRPYSVLTTCPDKTSNLVISHAVIGPLPLEEPAIYNTLHEQLLHISSIYLTNAVQGGHTEALLAMPRALLKEQNRTVKVIRANMYSEAEIRRRNTAAAQPRLVLSVALVRECRQGSRTSYVIAQLGHGLREQRTPID